MERKDKAMENIKLEKPYVFEGKEYTEIETSKLETLTVQDAIDAQARVSDQMAAVIVPESSTAYQMELAAKATQMPVEFFKNMPVRIANALRGVFMTLFAAAADKDEGAVLKLKQPYKYKGKTYTEVDMSGAAALNAMDMSDAENRMAALGHIAYEPSRDYLYCCIMAAKSSGMDEEFFTGLPIGEALHIKNALNSNRFFG